ncbi:MAG TPA: SGNH/GDSL hydrolase family protein [Burkholderiales bacterium]|nr:SGNH/GDSL hydrolase family protein [Burkholderiales bacterium]
MKKTLKLILSILTFKVMAIEINSFNNLNISGTYKAPIIEPIEESFRLNNAFYDVYIRCYYIDKNSRKANISYVWGKTEDNQYAVVKGNWYENTRLWNNIYYTKASDMELKQTCKNALKFAGFSENDFDNIFVNHAAAMWNTSYDANFWSDIKNPSFNGLSRIIVLGDSSFDNHNIFDKSYWKLPNEEGYFHGRFSNGPVMVEYLAKILNLPMKVIAEGGAEIKGSGSQGFLAKSLLEQFKLYKGLIDNLPLGYTNDINTTLFLVFIGSNDLKQQTDPTNEVSELINKYLFVIYELVKMGANNIIVPIFPDITLFPDIAEKIKLEPALKNKLDQQINSFNKGIEKGLEQFNDKTKYANLHIYRPNFDDMMMRAKIGNAFKNITNKCNTTDGYSSSPTAKTICSEPLDYFMWDGMHPSTKAHCMWANAVAEFRSAQLAIKININANCEYNYVHVK